MENYLDEEWRIIEMFPNYSISNFGRVRHEKTGRIRKSVRSKGLVHTSFVISKRKFVSVCNHILVYITFCDPDFYEKRKHNNIVIHHKDGDTHNNHASNLECITAKEASRIPYRVGRKGFKITTEIAQAIRVLYNQGITKATIGRIFSIKGSTVHYVLNNKNIYRFEYDTI